MSRETELLQERIGSPTCICGSEKLKIHEKKLESGIGVWLQCEKCHTKIKWHSDKYVRRKPKDTTQETLW